MVQDELTNLRRSYLEIHDVLKVMDDLGDAERLKTIASNIAASIWKIAEEVTFVAANYDMNVAALKLVQIPRKRIKLTRSSPFLDGSSYTMSIRLRNVLKARKCPSLQFALNHTDEELLRWPHMGRKSLKELRAL